MWLALALGAVLSATAPTDPADTAMRDLRTLVTALEAFSTDYDAYAQPEGRREGVAADLDAELAPIYLKSVPHTDPWGHDYRFVISDSRRTYAFYSLGPSGQLDLGVATFLQRLRKDAVAEEELTVLRTSGNYVFAGGMLVFAPTEVLRNVRNARSESGPFILHRQSDTPLHRSERDVELLAVAIETYLGTNDTLPENVRGKTVPASMLMPLLGRVGDYDLTAVDPWNRPYEIAVSPSGRRAAVYTRGEKNAIDADNETFIRQTLRGELIGTATVYSVGLVVTSLVMKK